MTRILTLLAMVLVLANAQCFVRCQLDSPALSAPPCHSQSKAIQDHCLDRHDLAAAHAPTAQLAEFVEATSASATLPIRVLSRTTDPSPPPLSAVPTTQPLRI